MPNGGENVGEMRTCKANTKGFLQGVSTDALGFAKKVFFSFFISRMCDKIISRHKCTANHVSYLDAYFVRGPFVVVSAWLTVQRHWGEGGGAAHENK